VTELPGADGEPFTYAARVSDDQAVRVVFGPGYLSRVAGEAQALGSRILLISGRHAAEPVRLVSRDLGDALAGRVDEVVQHVPVDVADRTTAAARDASADALLTIGGGSAVGLAKAVALVTGLPILAVPTTYAGSEMTPIWGRTDRGRKTTGRDPRVLPRVVVYDPTLTLSMPAEVTAASGMNALAHAVESLYAPDATPQSSAVAEEAIRALAQGLPVAVRHPADLEGRTVALRGAWLAGWALGSTTMGLHHKLAHVLGGSFGVPHAEAHSVLLPHIAAFNAPAAPDAFARAARALGLSGPGAVAPALLELAVGIGAPTSLADLALPADVLDDVAHTVVEVEVTNPRRVREDDVRDILHRAYRGLGPH
jgi:maleylacetate reductase